MMYLPLAHTMGNAMVDKQTPQDQLNRLPAHPQTPVSEDNSHPEPGIGLKTIRDIAWLAGLVTLFIVFWWSSSIYIEQWGHSGGSGKRVHVFGIMIQEEGNFGPQREYRHSGMPFGEILFNAIFLTLVFTTLFLARQVLIDVVKCWPRRVDAR